MMFETALHLMFAGAVGVVSLFFVMWIIHLILKNATVVDIGWGLGFILLSGIYTIKAQGFNLRNSLLFVMIFLWGMRIVFYLIKRIMWENQEDKRYQKFRQSFGDMAWLKFIGIFEFQAALQLIISIPLLAASLNPQPGISIVEIFGSIIFALGLIGEALADEQLHAFKKEPANKGKTCTIGLWYFSRHPNYFFEWVIWVGIAIYGLASPMGWAGIISPALMYYLLMYVSGIPLAEEQSLKSRGEEYRRYQATTSVFFPMAKIKVNI